MHWRKHYNLYQWSICNLWRHKAKSISIVFPLFLVMMVVSAVMIIKDGITRDADLSTAFLPDITLQSMVAGKTERLQLTSLTAIEKTEGIKKALPRIWGFLPLRIKDKDVVFTAMGISREMPIPAEIKFSMAEGSFLEKGKSHQIVIGQILAQSLKLKPGQAFPLNNWQGKEIDFKVVGVFKSAVNIYAADLVLMDIEDARELFGYSRQEASDLCIYLDNQANQDIVASKLVNMIPASRVLTRDALGKVVLQAFGGRAGIFQIFWLIALLTSILAAWTHWSGTRFLAGKEIGLLKATGWSTQEIIEVTIFETLFLGVLATLSGIVGGIMYVLSGAPILKNFLFGWTVVYPEFNAPYLLTMGSFLNLILIGIFPLLIAGVFNAWWLGVIEPARAMKEG